MMALSQPDRSLGFPAETKLEPRIFLRNASALSATITPTVNWRTDNGSGHSPLPRLKLRAGQMTVLNLADFQTSHQIPEDATSGTVTLNYKGRSGDLVAVAMSYDQTNRYGLQTPFSEIMNHLFKGRMWHADSLHDALITTGNGGTEPTKAQITLFYNAGKDKYRVEQTLAPGEQIWLNVGEVISKQFPDSDGNTIPHEVMFGSYELRDLGHPVVGLLYEGKLIVDKTPTAALIVVDTPAGNFHLLLLMGRRELTTATFIRPMTRAPRRGMISTSSSIHTATIQRWPRSK